MFIKYLIKKYFTVKYFKIWLFRFIKFDLILFILFELPIPVFLYLNYEVNDIKYSLNIEFEGFLEFLYEYNIYIIQEIIKFETENINHPVFGTLELVLLFYITYKFYNFINQEYKQYKDLKE